MEGSQSVDLAYRPSNATKEIYSSLWQYINIEMAGTVSQVYMVDFSFRNVNLSLIVWVIVK